MLESTLPSEARELGAFAARYSSSSFAILLPELDAEGSAEAAERIRSAALTVSAQVQAERVRSLADRLPHRDLTGDLLAAIRWQEERA